MNVLSLFDGMSCGQIALERAGIKVDKYFASEIKKDGIKVTMANYPNTIQLGDVCNVKYENGVLYSENGSFEVDIDLMIGGSPCQDFSQANKEKLGLEGLKSGLFYEWLRIKNEVSPKYYLLENVNMDCFSREAISQAVGTYPVEINSSLVSAQLRQRLYWTNIGREDFDLLGNRYCVIDLPEDKKIKLQSVLERGYTNRQKSLCLLEGYSRPTSTPSKLFFRYYENAFLMAIFQSESHFQDCVKYYKENYWGKTADEITDSPKVFNGVRTLSKLEMERLQTVPEGYTDCLAINQAASVLGDGWTVDVIAHIFSFLPEEYKVCEPC